MATTVSCRAPEPPSTSLQTFAIVLNFLLPTVALIVVILRTAGRLAVKRFGWDDWLVSTAMIMSVAETIFNFFFIKTNFIGIHTANIPPHDPTEGLIWAYAVQPLYNLILGCVKTSVLIFLLRLFGPKDRARSFLVGLNVVNLAQMTAVFFAIIFQCSPISFFWDTTIKGGFCVDRRALYTANGALNIATDLLIFAVPLWVFLDLKIPTRRKIGLLTIFLLGFLVTITSIVRLVFVVQAEFGLLKLRDPTFDIGFVTSGIETNLAIITASAPALRPFFRSRNRGGYLPDRFISSKKDADLEKALPGSVGWTDSTPIGGSGLRAKFGRGSNRGGRRGGLRSTRNARGGKKPIIRVRMDRDVAALRSQSPRTSEEETMTSNGIMRVSDIQREIDGIVREIASTGSGTYTGVPRLRAEEQRRQPTLPLNPPPVFPMNPTHEVDATWPSPGVAWDRRGDVRQYPEQKYTESIYSVDTRERDYGLERMSKYGDRRNAFYTMPRLSQAPSRNLTRSTPDLRPRNGVTWADEVSGKPF